MWILNGDERVLTSDEWACFKIGLEALRDFIKDDPEGQYGFAMMGVQVFDQLTAPQKLSMLADTCEALTLPGVPAPRLTAVNEGTVAALLQSFWNQLVIELDTCDDFEDEAYPILECRRALLRVFEHDEDPDTTSMIPCEDESNSEEWHDLFTLFESRFLEDTDYEMAALLDAPAEKSHEIKALMGIDDEYFVSVAPDPTELGMRKVEQKLAKLLGLPCPDDNGRFPAIHDRFTGLKVGPCTSEQFSQWSSNVWITQITLRFPSWDCDYNVWTANFTDELLAADPSEAEETPQLVKQRERRRQAALESLGMWPEF